MVKPSLRKKRSAPSPWKDNDDWHQHQHDKQQRRMKRARARVNMVPNKQQQQQDDDDDDDNDNDDEEYVEEVEEEEDDDNIKDNEDTEEDVKPRPQKDEPYGQEPKYSDDILEKKRKLIEVSYYKEEKNKIKQKLYATFLLASRKTHIRESLIHAVCEEGGGFLGGHWFCYVDHPQPNRSPRRFTKEFLMGLPFDVSTLRPLGERQRQSTSQWAKKVIELLCKKTKEALVCFTSVDSAATALGITVTQVNRACDTYVSPEQYDFSSYILRYKIESTAYEYGSHQSDYEQIQETHEERLARWKHLQDHPNQVDRGKVALANNTGDDDKGVKDMDESKKAKDSQQDIILRETLALFGTRLFDPNPTPLSEGRKMCVFCQTSRAEIMFEPCGHCVVCEKCAACTCQVFCPKCRTNIKKRKRSVSLFRGVRLDLSIKPRAFAPFQFMDFD